MNSTLCSRAPVVEFNNSNTFCTSFPSFSLHLSVAHVDLLKAPEFPCLGVGHLVLSLTDISLPCHRDLRQQVNNLQQMVKDREVSITDVEEVLRLARDIIVWPLRDASSDNS